MKVIRLVLLMAVALILLAGIWLRSNRTPRVDMTAYVPADSLIYIEANSLPKVADSILATDAWRALAPPAGINSSFSQLGWMSKLAAWTGIGSAETVVLSRAQIAVTVLALDTVEEGDNLTLKPRFALVAETHTSEARTRATIEKRLTEFARRAYNAAPQIERKEVDGAQFTTWSAPTGGRRIIAATAGSIAIVANDEEAVKACLAVRRGERASLASNARLEAMRVSVSGGDDDALAFGYVSPTGAARILEAAATIYAGQFSTDPRALSFAASILPRLSSKFLGDVGWSTHLRSGSIEDRYYLALPNDIAARLREPLTPSTNVNAQTIGDFLPPTTYSFSHYDYRDPEAAWRGLNAIVSSQLDMAGAFFLTSLLEASLKPYGIEDPKSFLRAIGPQIITARLNDGGASTVTIVQVRDEKALRAFVAKRLGRDARIERIGDAEMLVAHDAERGAASFVTDRLIMGLSANVRRCLEARAHGPTLADAQFFQRARDLTASNSDLTPRVVTYTNDETFARTFILNIASQDALRARPLNSQALGRALNELTYSVSETQLMDEGFMKTTRSSFGQIGEIFNRLASQ